MLGLFFYIYIFCKLYICLVCMLVFFIIIAKLPCLICLHDYKLNRWIHLVNHLLICDYWTTLHLYILTYLIGIYELIFFQENYHTTRFRNLNHVSI